MRVAVFSMKSHDCSSLDAANDGRHELTYLEPQLTPNTAALAEGTLHEVAAPAVG